ncbi:MAG: adenylate/guanylate cyclase domain-containing response regulator [Magnetococcales bacterium]|nr:adenylate/guanylate cyclase domain-containing response regulator [Magnetococcales bacterium]
MSSQDDSIDMDDLFDGDDELFGDEDDPLFADGDANSLKLDDDTQQDGEVPPDAWKILIVDDEPEIHKVTTLALDGVTFQGDPIYYLHAYSAKQAKEVLNKNEDIAMILLDVVMEEDDSGLKFVQYVRQEIKNSFVRIVLRTGQPGQSPEESVIVDYDINDYKSKVELTDTKLFSSVITALRSYRDLRIIEENTKQLKIFSDAAYQFVPVEFLQRLKKDSLIDIRLGDFIQMPMSILFCDIRSFTTLSETMTPRENFNFLNSYLHKMEPVIQQHNGFIDKYLGDGIMALFDNADHATKASLAMIKELEVFNKEQKEKGLIPIDIGCGVNSGVVALGTVGGYKRMDGTVISNAVNLAARVESLTKAYGVNILISESTYLQLTDEQRKYSRFLDMVSVKGKNQLTNIFEVFSADEESIRDKKYQSRNVVSGALMAIHSGDFLEAKQTLLQCLKENPGDLTLQIFLDRCDLFLRCPDTNSDLLGKSLDELKTSFSKKPINERTEQFFNKISDTRLKWLDGEFVAGSNSLLQYMKEHAEAIFGDEEVKMVNINYPHYSTHKYDHDFFKKRLLLLEEMRDSITETVFTVLLLSQAVDWFFNHIAIRDMQMETHFQTSS